MSISYPTDAAAVYAELGAAQVLPPHCYLALGSYAAVAPVVGAAKDVTPSPFQLNHLHTVSGDRGEEGEAPEGDVPVPGRAWLKLRALQDAGALFSAGSVAVPGEEESSVLDLPYGLLLPLGVTAFLAPAEWGKTTLLRRSVIPALQAQGQSVAVLSYVEPLEDALADVPTLTLSSPMQFLDSVAGWLADPAGERVLVVDSLRAFVYGRSLGGTGTGGVDRLFAPQLTALSNMVAAAGRSLLAVINPLSDSEEAYQIYLTTMRSSVPGVWAAREGVRPPGTLDRKLIRYARGPGVDRAAATLPVTIPASEELLSDDPPSGGEVTHVASGPRPASTFPRDPVLHMTPTGPVAR